MPTGWQFLLRSRVGMFSFLCKFEPVCFVLYYISSAHEAIQNMHGTVIGKQTVRISWGKTLANRQLRRTLMWGMYALTLAYAGTSITRQSVQLLHFVVSDVSDDVRRTVVLSLGFVLYSEPEQCVKYGPTNLYMYVLNDQNALLTAYASIVIIYLSLILVFRIYLADRLSCKWLIWHIFADINEVVLPSLMLNLRQKVSGTQKEQKLMKGWFSFLLGHRHGGRSVHRFGSWFI
ncbi:26S proteasome non-ATPase regulatory subunit 1 homolog A [Tanacetum coccineum]